MSDAQGGLLPLSRNRNSLLLSFAARNLRGDFTPLSVSYLIHVQELDLTSTVPQLCLSSFIF